MLRHNFGGSLKHEFEPHLKADGAIKPFLFSS